ncbi:MAG: selenocysteine lyase [Bacteroides sp. SM23_62]|nr:MAG: selenocysteine lyase [Bacteroides sp. SM23_62]
MSDLEKYFAPFRENIIGIDTTYRSPYGEQKIVYGDWIASGRLYGPIEKKMLEDFGPFVANTHTEASETGTLMTKSYQYAHELIKRHVNAGPNDVIITAGFGMTAVVNKLQRILGLKVTRKLDNEDCLDPSHKPVVFITHMEHHSNQTSWYETIADVIVLEPGDELLIDPGELRRQLEKYKDREFKIGAFTACSNVTGIETPYYELARIIHEYGGLCFVDFAASAPYVVIDMHPADPMQKLDAIYLSPHKFLGGPGSSGVLVFDKSMYKSDVPDNPGGGTVDWTNPWGSYKYVDDIEVREDGGTPGFLQAIRAALAFELKEKMGVENIRLREEEMVALALSGLRRLPGIHILADNVEDRLGVISFYHEKIHFNLMVKILSDRFGIQVRGGCVCAGTYGHFLLEVSFEKSKEITDKINHGDLSEKPGWVRWSLHPTTTDEEIHFFIRSVEAIIANISEWEQDYVYLKHINEFIHKDQQKNPSEGIREWFAL